MQRERPALWRVLRSRWPLVAALVLLILPPVIEFALAPTSTVFRYPAADAFYYHTIARNLAMRGFPTFDQHLATNGFHPLWQYLLGALYWLLHSLGRGDDAYLRVVFFMSLLCTAAGIFLVLQTLNERLARDSTWFLLLPTGIYGF